MRRAVTLLSTGTIWLLAGQSAFACSLIVQEPLWVDHGIHVAADGSFTQAGDALHNQIDGGKAVDLGRGRVGQQLTFSSYCSTEEMLLFVDCRSGELLLIDGQPVTVFFDGEEIQISTGGVNTTISTIQAPRGVLNWNIIDTSEDVISAASRAGYRYSTDVLNQVSAMKSRNRYDPFNGCIIHYPNSAGANQ